MNLRSQSACLINPRPRRTVPVSFEARHPAGPGTSERSGRAERRPRGVSQSVRITASQLILGSMKLLNDDH